MLPFDPDYCRKLQGFIYLASPYSRYPDGMSAAYHEACRCAAWLILHGINTFSPIAHSHPIALYGDIEPASHEIWMAVDRPLMKAASGLIVCKLKSWETSIGVKQEIEQFENDDKPILGLDWLEE